MAVVAQKVNFSQALPLGGVRQAVGADDVGQTIRQDSAASSAYEGIAWPKTRKDVEPLTSVTPTDMPAIHVAARPAPRSVAGSIFELEGDQGDSTMSPPVPR